MDPAADLERDPLTGAWRHRPSGRSLVSVTMALADVGLINIANADQEAVDRGTAVHRAIEAILRGHDPALEDRSMPFVEAFVGFLEGSPLVPRLIEERRYSLELGLTGQIDLIAELAGTESLIDIKTGHPRDWHALQTAGYALLLNQSAIPRYCLYLRKEGPKLVRHDSPDDQRVFLAALAVSHWRRGRKG